MLLSHLKILKYNSRRHLSPTASSSKSLSSFYDIVIVGGGLVGNAMACAIGANPYLKTKKVLLLEAGKKPASLGQFSREADYSNRVSAVSPSSVKFFKEIGAWEGLTNHRVQPISDLYVTDSCSKSNIRFNQLNSRSPIAYIVENEAIVSRLYDILEERCQNITIKTESPLKDCSIPENLSENARITLQSGEHIESSLIIGADGGKSLVRKVSSIDCSHKDYDQMAIVGTLHISSPSDLNNTIAWQRFTPQGPVALLPLNSEASSLVWTTSTADAQRLLNIPRDEFVDELNRYLTDDSHQSSSTNKFLDYLDQISSFLPGQSKQQQRQALEQLPFPYVVDVKAESVAAFPLSFVYARDFVLSRMALIGDAAHRAHPLAGQGVNLGWFGVQSLARALELAVKEGGDLGNLEYLKRYDTESRRHNMPVLVAIDLLNRLYSTESAPFVLARSLGLSALEKCLPLKDLVVHCAS